MRAGKMVVAGVVPLLVALTALVGPAASAAQDPVIVSLGDSYSSGEGTGDDGAEYDDGTDGAHNKCHRSDAAWPRLVGAVRGEHLACSGATTGTLLHGGGKDNNPRSQIERLRAIDDDLEAREGRHVDVVTLTIGGNDLGFAGIIGDCFVNNNCLAGFMAGEDAHLADLRSKLVDVITQIKFATPARIVLVGYPRLVPADDQPQRNCGWLTPVERRRVNQLAGDIDTTLRGFSDARVSVVSVIDALRGHELCTRDSWVIPVNPLRHYKRPEQGHPDRAGQRAIADVVEPHL